MALLRIDFHSNYLDRNVIVTAVIPADKMDGDRLAKGRRGPYRTVYLLHGLFGQDYDWIDKTHVVETAEARDIALIMPSGEDGLYLNKPEIDEYHGKFISEELVDFTRRLLPLSSKRQDTALAGISIGAYTAVINGLLRPDRFGSIIALSGAFMRDRVLEAVESHSLIRNAITSDSLETSIPFWARRKTMPLWQNASAKTPTYPSPISTLRVAHMTASANAIATLWSCFVAATSMLPTGSLTLEHTNGPSGTLGLIVRWIGLLLVR